MSASASSSASSASVVRPPPVVRGRTGRIAPAVAGNPAAANHRLRSLEYGLELLRRFTPEQPVRGIAELADGMDVSRPTAHRYASTCLDLGYLEQAPGRRYRLARRCAEPGMAMLGSLALIRAARPIVRELRQSTGRTVSLAVLRGDEALYLQRCCGFARGQYRLERGLGAGSRLPARDTAAGRALLAEIEARPPEIEARPPESGRAGERRRPREQPRSGQPSREQPPREQPRSGQPPRIQIPTGGLTVAEGDAPAGARGLALAVRAPGERTGAIEIVVPAEAIGAAEMVAELGEPLRAAGAALEAALAGERTEEQYVTELARGGTADS